MPQDDKEILGWKVVTTREFWVATALVAFLAFLTDWQTDDLSPGNVTQWIMIYSFMVVVMILAYCTILYMRYSAKLNSSIKDLELLHDILREDSLRNSINESKWLIHGKQVQEAEESDDVCENWTLTPDFHYEITDFQNVVIENLRKNLLPRGSKTKYEYIYPDHQKTRQRLDEFRESIVTSLARNLPEDGIVEELLKLNKYVRLYPIREDIVPLTEGIHNPIHGKNKTGLLMTPEESFPYYIKLDQEQTNSLVVKFRELKSLSNQEYKESIPSFLTREIIDECLIQLT